MPRGQKSKLRAREKHHQRRAETQGLERAQAAAGKEEEATCSSSSPLGEGPSSSVGAGTLQAPLSMPATTSAAADISYKIPTVKGRGPVKESRNLSQASASPRSPGEDLLNQKARKLVEYLLRQYKTKQPIRKADMLKIVHKWYRKDFPEILRRASENLDLVYGLELKEVNPSGNFYTLVYNQDDISIGSLNSDWEIPLKGILMPLLGGIFINGNCASEEEIWKFLNIWGIFDGRSHLIFGDPRKLITEDLVQEQYLVYQQVPDSDPPHFEFLWGPRAHSEVGKMKVLEFVTKLIDDDITAFPGLYEEALRDQEERAQARASTAPTAALPSEACGPSRDTPSSFPHPE